MTVVYFRNPETRLSAALAATAEAVRGDEVTLRELLTLVGEQGLLVFCAILAVPFLLPVTPPMMSTVCGLPMLLIASAVMLNRVVWLPERLLDRALPAATVRQVLQRTSGWAARFEHLVRPRLLPLSGAAVINVVNGGLLLLAVVALMAPLPLVPFANTLPGIAILLLCLGMAERDGILILCGYVATLVASVYVFGLLFLAVYAGLNFGQVWELLRGWWQ